MVGLGSLWRMAWRNAWRNPRRTGIVVAAVAIGLSGCLLSMAFNYGIVAQMVQTAIETQLGHVQVHAPGYEEDPKVDRSLSDAAAATIAALEAQPELASWSTRVRGQGLISSPRSSVGVEILGVDPVREGDVSRLRFSLSAGEWFGQARQLLMGERLARRLQVDVGDKVVVSVQEVGGGLTGQALRIGGLFRTASSELDQGTLVLRIAEAQQLFGLGDGVTEVVALAKSDREIEALRAGAATLLGDAAEVRSWEELQPLLVYMVDTFDSMAWALYGAVFIAMAFGIANVLLMAVYERTREIGMMRAMGMRRERVVALIVIESLLVVLFGFAVGIALALGSLWALSDGIDLSAYAEGLGAFGVGTRIVPVVRREDFAIPLAVASLSALIASLWPAIRAAGLRPADALRKL